MHVLRVRMHVLCVHARCMLHACCVCKWVYVYVYMYLYACMLTKHTKFFTELTVESLHVHAKTSTIILIVIEPTIILMFI